MLVTVSDIITWMEEQLPKKSETVDQLLYGNRNQPVEKVAVAFMPSIETIKQAKRIGADLLICHESPYYNHQNPQQHESSVVMKQKIKWLKEQGLAIYRNHDSVHRQQPDLITKGLVKELGWEKYRIDTDPIQTSIQIPETSFEAILLHIKEKLNLKQVKYVGNLTNQIRNISLSVGYRGSGEHTIPQLEKNELVIYGEGPEWETPEYVKDALALGMNKNIIILGHMQSEEPGMKLLAGELAKRFPEVKAEFIAANSFIHLYDVGNNKER